MSSTDTDSSILSTTEHRPWPLPQRPWVMKQNWHDLLFAHWPVPVEQLRPLVPPKLDIELFDGTAWVGVVPFWMSGVRLRMLPSIPTAAEFPELNVRTYVRTRCDPEKPGVYFFSLDASSVLAVLGARAWVGLPYFWAAMKVRVAEKDDIQYRSLRRQSPRGANLLMRYRPTGPVGQSKSDFERFLTERYCLYVVRIGRVHRVEIHHVPWPLQAAEAEFEVNTMAQASGIHLPQSSPVLHFAKLQQVYIYLPEELG